MNILILNGSPRHTGNTHSALRLLEEKLHALGAQTQFVDVCNLKLTGCQACDTCKKNGGRCVMDQDSAQVIDQIAQADAVVFGTPVYWWGMSAQLKMVVDKFYPQDGPFHKMNKKIGVLVVGANAQTDPQYELIGRQFSCIADYLGWETSFQLSFSAWEAGEVMKQPGLEEKLSQAAENLVK